MSVIVDKYTNFSQDSKKMKFLDDLFGAKCEQNSTESTIGRTYIKLSDSADYTRLHSKQSQNKEEKSINNQVEEINKIFSINAWICLTLSFFVLCYLFSFRMIIIVPLLLIVFMIYSFTTYGNRFYSIYLNKIRSFINSKIRKMKGGNDDEEETFTTEYKLMEI